VHRAPYEVDWWTPKPGNEWGPVERGEFDDADSFLMDNVLDVPEFVTLKFNLLVS
jgi:hypothetical protein